MRHVNILHILVGLLLLHATTVVTAPSVSVYDNWIDFGTLTADDGTYATPVNTIAAEDPPIYSVDGATNYDLAGIRIQADRRLRVLISISGHLTRVESDGSTFAGIDTRKTNGSGYELLSEFKINLFGRFYELTGAYGAGATYVSPTSGVATNFNSWTGWTNGGGSGNANLAADDGWLNTSSDHAWTGNAQADQSTINLIVERDQESTGTYQPAEIWMAERVKQRGLQDASGNYAQTIEVFIHVAE